MRTDPKAPSSSELPMIRGSTATILTELYKRSMNLSEASSEDPVLKRCVAFDAELMHAKNDITPEAATPEEPTIEAADALSKTLETDINKFPKTINKAEFIEENKRLSTNVASLKQKQAQLQQQYRSLVVRQREEVSELIINKPKRNSQDISKTLTRLESDIKQFKTTVAQFKTEQTYLFRDLDRLDENIGRIAQRGPARKVAPVETPRKG